MADYIADGAIVRDDLRARSGGVAEVVRGYQGRPAYIDVRWPEGFTSRYGLKAAAESLEVETAPLFDIFGLGARL